jgi:hypothetical protein
MQTLTHVTLDAVAYQIFSHFRAKQRQGQKRLLIQLCCLSSWMISSCSLAAVNYVKHVLPPYSTEVEPPSS